MNLSPAVVAELRNEWAGVVSMRDRMQLLVVATFGGGAITGVALQHVLYNLPLLLAFDVLKQALEAARAEKVFTCRLRQLGDLMECAKSTLDWKDWTSLREGVRRRNEVAHDGKLFDGKQCLADIDNVEAQLRSWQVIG